MTQIKSAFTRANYLAAAVALVFAAILAVMPFQIAAAGALLDRSLMVTSTQPGDDTTNGAGETITTPGHPNNGANVGHTYTFSPYTTSNTLESFKLVYCNTPFGYLTGDCDGSTTADFEGLPLGMDVSNATEATVTVYNSSDVQQAQDTFTGALAATRDNVIELEADGAGVAVGADQYVVIEFTATASNYFVNPEAAYLDASGTPADQTHPTGTYFVNITTYTDSLTTDVDSGTVTNSITSSISIETRVQESLNFSVEGDARPGGVLDGATDKGTACDPLIAGTAIKMGDSNNALAHDTAYDAYSYFRLATNSSNGANVFYSGETLTSGTNTIDAIGFVTGPPLNGVVSTPGTEQFGLAFDSDHTDHELTQLVSGLVYEHGLGDLESLDPNEGEFGFVAGTPTVIATSPGVVQCDTGAIRYIANISPDTEAGIYTTKINYIASPAY